MRNASLPARITRSEGLVATDTETPLRHRDYDLSSERFVESFARTLEEATALKTSAEKPSIGVATVLLPPTEKEAQNWKIELAHGYDSLGSNPKEFSIQKHTTQGERTTDLTMHLATSSKGRTTGNVIDSGDSLFYFSRGEKPLLAAGVHKTLTFDKPTLPLAELVRERLPILESVPFDFQNPNIPETEYNAFFVNLQEKIGTAMQETQNRGDQLFRSKQQIHTNIEELQQMLQQGENWFDNWPSYEGETSIPMLEQEIGRVKGHIGVFEKRLDDLAEAFNLSKEQLPSELIKGYRYQDDPTKLPISDVLRIYLHLDQDKIKEVIGAVKNVRDDTRFALGFYANKAMLDTYGAFDTLTAVRLMTLGLTRGLDRRLGRIGTQVYTFNPHEVTRNRDERDSLWGEKDHSYTGVGIIVPPKGDAGIFMRGLIAARAGLASLGVVPQVKLSLQLNEGIKEDD